VSKAEAQRKKLIDQERAKLDAAEQPTAEVATATAEAPKAKSGSRKAAAVAAESDRESPQPLSEATQAVIAAAPKGKAKKSNVIAQAQGITAVQGAHR
jgi:hypothetical protein